MITRLSRPYAKAFLQTAGDLETSQRGVADLARFQEAIEAVPRLGEMAQNPGIPPEVRQRTVAEVAAHLELDDHAVRLLRLLTENFRMSHLPAILETAVEMIDRRTGVVRATVTSAQELDTDQRRQLEAALRDQLGKDIRLELAVDPELIGGFVVQIGSVRYDGSVEGQLERLSRQLSTAA